MKINKSIITASALLLATVASQAQVVVRITGATAFRSQTYSVIRSILDAGYTQNPASGSSSNLVTWTGSINSLFPGQSVTIEANYNGAVAGIQNLTQGTTATFLAATNPVGTYSLETNTADIAFSSVFQASTAYTTPVLNDTIFGATPVYWVKSKNTYPGFTNYNLFTNITAQQIKTLAANGYLPASYFTGNSNDYNFPIYFITRDTSAGQRVIVLRDSVFTGNPLSYSNNGTAWVSSASGIPTTPTIVNQLNNFGVAVSYITGVDAISVTNGSILSYNGALPFTGSSTLSSVTNNYAPLINGQYSLWGYEHLLSLPGTSGNTYKFLTNLQAQLSSTLGTTNYAYSVPTNQLNVVRSSDGGKVSPL